MATAFATPYRQETIDLRLGIRDLTEGMRLQIHRAGRVLTGRILRAPQESPDSVTDSTVLFAPEVEPGNAPAPVHVFGEADVVGGDVTLIVHPQGELFEPLPARTDVVMPLATSFMAGHLAVAGPPAPSTQLF